MIAAWDRIRSSSALKGAFLFAVAALIVTAAWLLPSREESPLSEAERFAFDQQMRVLRDIHPRALDQDIVLIGTNEDTYRAFDEPFAIWHRHFAAAFHALAKAKPKVVGIDFVLPERSFDKIAPGIDLAMMRGLLDLRRSTHLVYVQTTDSQGRLVEVQRNYRNIVTPENLGVDQHYRDPDGVSRRFGPMYDERGEEIPTLVSQMLKPLGVPAREGYIDYSVGVPLAYVPLHEVAQWDEDRLRRTFAGRVVFMGSLVGFVDRWRLPTKLLAEDPGRPKGRPAGDPADFTQPGVLIHVQALRSHMGPGLLKPLPLPLSILLAALAASAVLIAARAGVIVTVSVIVPLAMIGASLAAVVGAQLVLPIATLLVTFWVAIIARSVFDAVEAVVERLRLHQSFAGQVSPGVMKEMMNGSLSPGVSGQLAEVCVLFSDIRDFTTLSESMPPQTVTAVLQRYFDRMVKAVHRYDGTVDKFIGDGMMILFGAPRKSEDPCGDAVQCALAMMEGLDALNGEFRSEGLPVLEIGIGINYGTVTVGNIGSSERHNYSAIGDVVNVAARLEGLTKDLGRKILITEAVVERIGDRFQFDPLGSHKVKGHSPVNVWGMRSVRAGIVATEVEVEHE